ncbi:MAG: hypothetical protein LBK73_09545 [Treponema sp.]|nr:hypothetical protein [Treponema sp.]
MKRIDFDAPLDDFIEYKSIGEMNLLLDTHALIWFFNGDLLLSKGAKRAIVEAWHRKFISIASVWEAAIKNQPE